MSLVFTAIMPNDSHFIEESLQAKQNGNKPSQTFQAIKELEGEFYIMKPDTVIILTEYMTQIPELVNTNISNVLEVQWPKNIQQSLQNDSKTTFSGDVEFAAHLKGVVDKNDREVLMTIIAEKKIPPKIATPITLLLDHLPETKTVVISTGDLSFEEHFAFGSFLRQEILQTNKRVAVIAAGHLTKNGKWNEQDEHDQESLDSLCLKYLKEKHPEKIAQIDKSAYEASGSDLLNPLSILLGVVDHLNIKIEVLSYEQLHNSGQLVSNFILK